MSTKTYFKRISLAVIFALSFGALSSAPSQAVVSGSGAVALSAATDSKVALETSTVTITASMTSTADNESFTVRVVGTGANTAAEANFLRPSLADSANIGAGVSATDTAVASTGLTYAATSANTFTRVKATFTVFKVDVVGTHIYTVNVLAGSTIIATTTFTLTVAAANTDASSAQSLMYINDAPTLTSARLYTMADSSLVKSAGQLPTLNLMTPAAVAYLGLNFRNSAGESVVSTTGTNVDGRMTVKITSGPGLLSDSTGALVRQVTVTRSDTVTIYNDGSSGVTTIVGYIGGAPLAQAAKT